MNWIGIENIKVLLAEGLESHLLGDFFLTWDFVFSLESWVRVPLGDKGQLTHPIKCKAVIVNIINKQEMGWNSWGMMWMVIE